MLSKKKYNDAAGQVAEIFGVSTRYVYLILENDEKYRSKKADAIREAYKQYKTGKNNLIRSIERTIKIA